MKQIGRRRFVQATGALVAAPALASLPETTASAQDVGDMRVDSDIVFGRGGGIHLLLDVYHPPEGMTPKRMAIIHLFGGGFFHSDQMRVVERFTRTGNEMLYEVTVDDPEVLVRPWVMHPRILQLSNNPTIISEQGSCTETELDEVSSQIRH